MKHLKRSWIAFYILTGISILAAGLTFGGYIAAAQAATGGGESLGLAILGLVLPIYILIAGAVFLVIAITLMIIFLVLRNKKRREV